LIRSLPPLWIALAFAVLVLQARIVVGGKTFDDVRYHTEVAPPRLAAADAVASAEVPGWWDGTGFGVPLLGEPTHGAAYPAVWLASSPRALDWLVILHLWWFALGAALWARRAGASQTAALVSGVFVATSGVALASGTSGVLFAAAHVPWIAVCAANPVLVGILVAAIGLAGQPGILLDALVLAIVLGARDWRAFAALVAGLAVSAVQWWPAVRVLPATAGADVHGLSAARFAELFVPSPVFVGAALIGLAVAVRWTMRAGALAAGAALATIVWGRGGWPSWLGPPEAHLAVVAAIAAAEAARAVDLLLAGDRRTRLVVAATAVLGAIALAAIGASGTARAGLRGDGALINGALGLACIGFACWLARPADRAPVWRTALLAVLLVAPGIGATPTVTRVIPRAVVEEAPPWARLVADIPEPRRLFRPSLGPPADLDAASATLANDLSARWGVAVARTTDPARPRESERVWLGSTHLAGEMARRFGVSIEIVPLAITGIVVGKELGRRGSDVLTKVPADPPAATLANWVWASNVAIAIDAMFPPGGRSPHVRRLVLAGSGVANEDEPAEPVPCTIERWSHGTIDLACTAPVDSYAAVTSSPAEGWSVEVDERAVTWVTADVLRRAVAVPAGAHRIAWRYTPPGFMPSVLLALCGVAGLAALALTARRASRRASRRSR
jgi:hypothetical protein